MTHGPTKLTVFHIWNWNSWNALSILKRCHVSVLGCWCWSGMLHGRRPLASAKGSMEESLWTKTACSISSGLESYDLDHDLWDLWGIFWWQEPHLGSPIPLSLSSKSTSPLTKTHSPWSPNHATTLVCCSINIRNSKSLFQFQFFELVFLDFGISTWYSLGDFVRNLVPILGGRRPWVRCDLVVGRGTRQGWTRCGRATDPEKLGYFGWWQCGGGL